MKTLTQIRNERAVYFVCIDGTNEFESYSLTDCKNYLINYLKNNEIDTNTFDYFIGMYNIDID